ncbi:hypothetical protein FHX82_000535 [Amycolatopsis bartoniae]|uniref:Uncharacterized protein n=1 Tax=Amycolatopsis bartoniae TaxID=941986 RepID=A0A8H9IT37_9PSEU|nr:hypothetical protein [Amycolatopsis bartoniae]MBB2933515.1 hypothetical protein [Amycolatopsis bartoniae]TVT07614.1 hypothetical protein FNH07_15740 [Amycolatopsis bartoniae]GHF60030.1 hypothetical protein GCM10017566_37040 [Amycolatopsis bartoniae]
MGACGERAHPAVGGAGLRAWARSLLISEWAPESVLDVLVVLEELVAHVCATSGATSVRLTYRSGNCLRIEVVAGQPPVPLSPDVGGLLVRNIARACGTTGTTYWADVSLTPRRVPAALPGGRALASGGFELARPSVN